MRHYLTAFLVLCSCCLHAQDLEKDTIQLKEVLITNIPVKKGKVKKVKYRSPACTFLWSDNYYDEIVMQTDGLPHGYVQQLSFYVNKNTFSDKVVSYNTQDKDIEIVFYAVAPNGAPGARIALQQAHIPKDFKGKYTTDVSALMVYNPGTLFVGIKVLNPSKSDDRELEIDCLCKGKNKYATYVWGIKDKKWLLYSAVDTDYALRGIKMDITVATLK